MGNDLEKSQDKDFWKEGQLLWEKDRALLEEDSILWEEKETLWTDKTALLEKIRRPSRNMK